MLASTGWIVLAIGTAYLVEKYWPSAHSVTPTTATPVSSTVGSKPIATPVRFINPFDEEEVFEFPAGTSGAEAREAVSRILLERARERVPSWPLPRRTASTDPLPQRS
jgi:hypothetical protein